MLISRTVLSSCVKASVISDALLAPVGENWWSYMKSWPDLEMYDADGAHASLVGSDFAAKYIWEAIVRHYSKRR